MAAGLRQLRTTSLLLLGTVAVGIAQGSAKPVADPQVRCQITVPADWTVQGTSAFSPDKRISATPTSVLSRTSFDDAKNTAKDVARPVKVLEDDKARFVYTFDPGSLAAGRSAWYAIVRTAPVCAATLLFQPGADAAVLKRIADSIAPVPPKRQPSLAAGQQIAPAGLFVAQKIHGAIALRKRLRQRVAHGQPPLESDRRRLLLHVREARGHGHEHARF
jgi:hypothetical protein